MGASHPLVAFGLIALVQVIVIWTMSMLSISLPRIQQDLGTSTQVLALITAAFAMSLSGLLLLGGREADRRQPVRCLQLGMLAFLVGCLVSAFAPEITTLLVGRFLQGAGAAFAVPAAMALVSLVYPDAVRYGRAMAAWGVLTGLGGALGLVYGGLVDSWSSWRWTFTVPVLVTVAVLGAAGRVLPERQGAVVRQRLPLASAVTGTVALVALTYGLVLAPERGWGDPQIVGALAVGAVSAALFAGVDRVAAHPLLPARLLRRPAFGTALAAVFLAAAAITTTYYVLALYFADVLGWTGAAAALAFTPLGGALVLTSMVVGRAIGRWGPAPVLVAGLVVTAAGLGLLGAIGPTAGYGGPVLAGLLVLPVGVIGTFAAATVLATAGGEPGDAGQVGGVVNAAMEAGPTLGLALLVSLGGLVAGVDPAGSAAATLTDGWSLALRAAGGVALLLAAVVALSRRRSARPGPSIDPQTPTKGMS